MSNNGSKLKIFETMELGNRQGLYNIFKIQNDLL